MKKASGIHHITAIAGHPQENVDFYAGILGMRLVKQTVNFDDPKTYHFYFGDENGSPGTLITFFPWPNAYRGKIGDGQVGVTSYAVPKGSLPFWEKRLERFKTPFKKTKRFDGEYLQFEDVHGLKIELAEREGGKENRWIFGEITPDVAIKGFAGAVLYSLHPDKTADLLQRLFGFEKIGKEGDFVRLKMDGEIGNVIDIKQSVQGLGRMGVGTVHHIAWRAEDDRDQIEWKNLLEKYGYMVTDVKDRNYFKSIYFRERGQVLFEIATDPPGFGVDESFEELGFSLKLPSQYELYRSEIESVLPPFEVRSLDK